MTNSDHPISEKELDAFLAGADPLAQQLQQLAKDPSDALTAAIMARVAAQHAQTTSTSSVNIRAIADQTASNDAPHLQLVAPLSDRVTWWHLYRAPLAMAASFIIAIFLTWQWQSWHQEAGIPTVAQNSAKPASSDVLAKADTTTDTSNGDVRLRDVDPAFLGVPDPMKPSSSENLDAGKKLDSPLKPDVWLAKIEQLIKQNKLPEAKAEYLNFHKTYPEFVLPEATELLFIRTEVITAQ